MNFTYYVIINMLLIKVLKETWHYKKFPFTITANNLKFCLVEIKFIKYGNLILVFILKLYVLPSVLSLLPHRESHLPTNPIGQNVIRNRMTVQECFYRILNVIKFPSPILYPYVIIQIVFQLHYDSVSPFTPKRALTLFKRKGWWWQN